MASEAGNFLDGGLHSTQEAASSQCLTGQSLRSADELL